MVNATCWHLLYTIGNLRHYIFWSVLFSWSNERHKGKSSREKAIFIWNLSSERACIINYKSSQTYQNGGAACAQIFTLRSAIVVFYTRAHLSLSSGNSSYQNVTQTRQNFSEIKHQTKREATMLWRWLRPSRAAVCCFSASLPARSYSCGEGAANYQLSSMILTINICIP